MSANFISPIIESTRQELEKAEKLKAEIIERKARRIEFWMAAMDDEEQKMTDRLRASELSAKADGDFVERREVTIANTYREILMTRAGSLEELEPPHKIFMLEADFVEEAEDDTEDLNYEVQA